MQPMTGDKPVDVKVVIRCQVSSYMFDEREETDMKVEAQISINQSGAGAVDRTEVIHKKTFDSNHPIPSGQFFWETTNNLKSITKKMLMEL